MGILRELWKLVDQRRPPTAPIVWYHEAYRLPLPSVERQRGVELRRADFAAWTLLEHHRFPSGLFRKPGRVSFRDLSRVHTRDALEALMSAETLARVFAVSPDEIAVDAILDTVRYACGGTLAAAREALRSRTVTLNLLGGFHHASPSRLAALSPCNDVAVAIAALRESGLRGPVVVIDLDAHPPDGTAECLRTDPDAWIGSLSGAHWETLPTNVDETVLGGAGEHEYLGALRALLGRMPARPVLAFVIAGGDVLAGDAMGKLGLGLGGVQRRDAMVHAALGGVPAVWLPGGGYHPDSWKLLVGTALVIAGRPGPAVAPGFDPMRARYADLGRRLGTQQVSAGPDEDDDLGLSSDVMAELGMRPGGVGAHRLLGFYTATGVELALEHYGVLDYLRRAGFRDFRVDIDRASQGDRVQLFGVHQARELLLASSVLEVAEIDGRRVLYVNWLMLQDPRATFTIERPRLPGQEAPGLGLGREAQNLFRGICDRLGLAGVAFRPAHYHTAYISRTEFAFVDPERQGRFEALMRDLAEVPLAECTAAIAAGRVRLEGHSEPYRWEPDPMMTRLERTPEADEARVYERTRCRFLVTPPPTR